MKDSQVSFPYPVLGNGDDVLAGSTAALGLEFSIADESVTLRLSGLGSENKTLEDLVDAGAARWMIRVKCARTYLRRTFLANGSELEHRFEGPDLYGRVEVETYVIATQGIDPYRPAGINTDYHDTSFSVPAGGMLALGPVFAFDVEKDFDALKAPVASIMAIEEGEHQKGSFKLVLDDDKIIIRLSRDDWKNEYDGVRDRVPQVIHSSLVLPALAEAIRVMADHESTAWSGRLKAIIERRGISRASCLETAQLLLDAPVSRSFAALNARLDRQEN